MLLCLMNNLLFCFYNAILSFCKRERGPGIDTESYDQESLYGMYDEHEPQGLFIGYAIEDEHRFDGEMPGTCTVWGGYDDGKVCYHEGYQRTANSQICGKVKAEEREVVMQEIHHPDTDREKQVKRQVLYTP